ncbi:MAG: tetratricopeptide repeat protein [Chloroherpetonaceae bacterium]|nr:tetratricopeptide repeat protein [Chloroherpetonaceae bacterium]
MVFPISNIGNVYFAQSDYQNAARNYREALRGLKRPDHLKTIALLSDNLGQCIIKLGDFTSAAGLFQTSLKISHQIGLAFAEGSSYQALGDLYRELHDFEESEKALQMSLFIRKRIGDLRGQAHSLEAVRSVKLFGNQLVVGGDFTSVGSSLPANRLAILNTTNNSWSLLGTNSANGVNGRVTSIEGGSASRFAVGGAFTSANAELGNLNVNRIAIFSKEIGLTQWKPIGFSDAEGTNDTVRSIAYFDGNYWAGGKFSEVGIGNNEFSSGFGSWEDQNNHYKIMAASLPISPIAFTGTSSAVGISNGGSGTISVRFFPTKPINPEDIPINVSPYRWVISQSGFDLTFGGQFFVNLSQLPNNGITGPASIKIFQRRTIGVGGFNELSTTYLESTAQLRANFSGDGEFALGGLPGSVLSSPELNSPRGFQLDQNYPNPFNPETRIQYQLPASSFVTLEVFDVLGRKIVTLLNQNQKEGNYSIRFNASQFLLTSGAYFYRLKAGNYVETKKMVLVK